MGENLLRRTSLLWFSAAVAGQGMFVLMILAFYGRRTVTGNFAGWNDKPHIKSYVPGDTAGNVMFALHVLLAAVVTAGGLLQLATGFMMIGIGGAIAFMWWPHMT